MNIGEKITSLRKQHNLTQEQLAKALGVSVPAVSKWEHGVTAPDISLLSPLARMLHTDVNNLLSFQKNITEKEVDDFMEEIQKICAAQGYLSGMEKAFEFLKKYPNNIYLKLKTANAVTMYAYTAEEEEEEEDFQKWLDKSVALLEEICHEKGLSEDSSMKEAAIIVLSSRYIQKGRLEEAEQLLESLPSETYHAEQMLPRVYLEQGRTEDARKQIKGMKDRDFVNLLLDIKILFDISVKEENMEEALQHAREYYQIRKAMPVLVWLHPSELLVEAYLLMDDLEHAMKHFSDFIDEMIETEQGSYEGSGIFLEHHVMYRIVENNPLYQPLLEMPKGKEKMKELLSAGEELSSRAYLFAK